MQFAIESMPPLVLMLVKATAVLSIAVIVSLLLQRRSAGLRHIVWLTAVAGVLVLPAIAAWSPLSLKVLPATFSAGRQLTISADPVAPQYRDGQLTVPQEGGAAQWSNTVVQEQVEPPTGGPVTVAEHVGSRFRFTLWRWALGIWAVVALALLGRLMIGMIAVRRIVRAAVPVESPDVTGILYDIADRIGLERTPRVLISSDIAMPFASGIVAATIVLPRSSSGWTEEQLSAVLIHELAHVWRRDMIGHALARVVCAVYWFHPMVWMAARRLRDASERACDDLALELGSVPSSYAEHLLDLVTSARVGRTPAVAMALAQRSEFEGRMLAILDPRTERRHPTRRQAAGLASLLAALTIVLAAAAPAEARLAGETAPSVDAGLHTPVSRTAAAPVSAVQPESSLLFAIEERTSRYDSASVAEKRRRAAEAGFIDDTIRRNRTTAQQQRDMDRAVDDLSRSAAEFGVGIAGNVLNALAGRSEISAERQRDLNRATGDLGRVAAEFGVGMANEVLDGLISGSRRTYSSEMPAADPKRLARLLVADPDPGVRTTAAWGLEGKATDREVVAALAKAVTYDRDAGVRKMAACPMSSIRSPEAIEPLGRALSDQDAGVREMAAWSLGTIGEDGAVRPLGELLGREQVSSVQVAAAWALGQIAPERAPVSLARLLASSNSRVVAAAAWAVAEIGDRSMASEVVKALEKPQEGAAVDALIRAAVMIDIDPGSIEMEKLLNSSDSQVRRAATRMISGQKWTKLGPWPWPRPITSP